MTKEEALKIESLFINGYLIKINSGFVDGFIISMEVADKILAKEYSCNNVKEGDMFIESDALACSLENYTLTDISIYKEIDINTLK